MVTFLALYRGESVASAELVAVATDPELVSGVAGALLASREEAEGGDPVLGAIRRGRRRALRAIRQENGRADGPALVDKD